MHKETNYIHISIRTHIRRHIRFTYYIYTHTHTQSKSKFMNRVKKSTEFITNSEEHITSTTMQDFSSTVSFSPSFSFYASGNLVEAAVRALREESFFHFPTTTMTTLKRSSDNDDVAADLVTSKNLFYGGWTVDPPSLSSPAQSHSSSESDDLDLEIPSPSRYYCFWSPIRSPARGDSLKIKTKSSSEPRRCRLKELLRRSHSDGAVSTSSASKRCSFKDLLRRSHSHGGGGGGEGSSISPSGNNSPVKERSKTASYKPEVDKRRKSYLPYRQDLIGVFAGMSRLRH